MKKFLFKSVFLCILAFISLKPSLAPEIQDFSQQRFKNIIIKYRNNIRQWEKISLESAYGLKETKYLPIINVHIYEPFMKQSALLYTLQQNPLIEYAEPDYEIHTASYMPNDPYFIKQWGLHNLGQNGGIPDIDIDAPEAWEISTGGKEVVVAVIDTGIDYHHEDLQKNIWTNSDEIPYNGLDDDNNGYVDDYYGINAASGTGDPSDDNGHGTHSAGIIGAVGNNGIGVSGVCWDVQLMALKCLNHQGQGYISDAIECIQYALDKNVQIINCPWGTYNRSFALEKAIEAGRERGTIFVVPAGNNGLDIDIFPFFPASYDCENIISVGAIDKTGNKPIFSNYGDKSVDIFAPGKDIFSTLPYNRYDLESGTSEASSYVAGSGALIKSFNSNLDWNEIRDGLIRSCEAIKGRILNNSAISLLSSFNCLNFQSKSSPSKGSKFNADKNRSLSESILTGNRGEDYGKFQGQNTPSQNNKQTEILHGGDVHAFIAEQAIKLILEPSPSPGGPPVLAKDEFQHDYENDLSKYWLFDPNLYLGIRNGTIKEDEILGSTGLDMFTPTIYHFWKPWSSWDDGLEVELKIGGIAQYDSSLKRAIFERKPDILSSQTKSFWEMAIDLYKANEKDSAFFYLGRAIHLLEDMSVPAHTLNDPHSGGLLNLIISQFANENIGDENYEIFTNNYYTAWTNTATGLTKIDIIDPNSLPNPFTWNSFPPEITNDPYKTRVARIFYSMAKNACFYESDNQNGYSDGTGNWTPDGINKQDYQNQNPPWYSNENELLKPGNEEDLTETRCQMIALKLMPLAIRFTASLLKTFSEAVDNIAPISQVKINGQEVTENGQEYQFISGPVTIEFNAQDTGPAGLDRINWKLGNDAWKSSLDGDSYIINNYGSYTLLFYSIDRLGNVEKVGDQPRQVNIIIGESESTFSGYLDSNNTSASHSITLPADGESKFKIEYDSTLSIWSIQICDIDNTVLFFQTPPQNGVIYGGYGLKAGTYNLKVTRNSGSGNYTLTTTYNAQTIPNDTEPDDTFPTAQPAPNNGETPGHLGYRGGGNGTTDTVDVYKTTLNTDGESKLKIEYDSTLSIWSIQICDIDNTVLFSQMGPQNGVIYGGYGLKAGTYYLKITRDSGYGGYTLTTIYAAQTIPNDTEPDDTFPTAQPAPNNGETPGHLGYRGGGNGTTDTLDVYKTTLNADGESKLKIEYDSTLSIWSIQICDIDNTILFSQTLPQNGVIYGGYGLKAGTYYLKITRDSGYGGYTLTTIYAAQTIANDTEPDDTFATAQPAPNNGETPGHLGYRGGGTGTTDTLDIYITTLTASGELKFKIIFDSTLSVDSIRIYDINGSLLYSKVNPLSGVIYGPYELMAGTYYLKITRNTGYGGYTLQIQTSTVMPLTVTTTPVSNITMTTVQSGGNVISDGGAAVTERGVCWSLSANPTTANPHTHDGTGTGSFVSNITGLTPGTNYHVRAYATNASGIAYGSDISFITNVVIPGVRNDFNGDGKEDVLWRYYGGGPAQGSNYVWYMNGVTVTGGALLPTISDTSWQIGGTGDFNGDGKTDILWRNYSSGLNYVWYMDGVTVTGGALLPAISDTSWQIGGTGDFNGDGKVDILWRSYSSGLNYVWYMNGVTVTGGALLPVISDTNWQIGGTGDFNGDGKVDILWRNYSSGLNYVWYMDGVTVTGGALLPEISDTSWQIGGTGDFNGDGKVDILWRSYSSGLNYVWYMNGVTCIGGDLLVTVPDLTWRIVNR